MTIMADNAVTAEYRCPVCKHLWVERWLRDDKGRIVAVERE